MTIESIIPSLMKRLRNVAPSVARALRPGASSPQRSALARALGLAALPPPLDAWFAWHDGYSIDDIDGEESLDPDRAYNAISIAECLAAWRFLSDENEEILQPWSRDWLPIMDNGAGDYVVYVIRGATAGRLIDYFHDDARRPEVAPSLLSYLTSMDERLAALERQDSAR